MMSGHGAAVEPGTGSSAQPRTALLPTTDSIGKANAQPHSISEIHFPKNSPQTSGETSPSPPVATGRADFAPNHCIRAMQRCNS